MSNNKQRTFFGGLYGSDSIDFVKGLVYIYPFGVIGKQNNNTVKPHAHNNQFQIFLLIQGETLLLYQREKISVRGPSIIIIPKNTEHGFEHLGEQKGWIISFSDAVLEHMIKREADVISALETFRIIQVTSGEYSESIFQTMLNCIQEYKGKQTGRLLMLEYIAGQIIVQLNRLPDNQQLSIFSNDNTSTIYYRRFTQLVRSSGTYKKTIEQYASELNITTGHLSRICRAVTGKSPKEIIMDVYIAEAQLQLSDIEKSINEICYSLGFEDPSYFARVFKRKVGISPNEFRKERNIKS